MLDINTPRFRILQVWPLVQSLPELLHHAPTVVDMLLALLENPVVVTQVRPSCRRVSYPPKAASCVFPFLVSDNSTHSRWCSGY